MWVKVRYSYKLVYNYHWTKFVDVFNSKNNYVNNIVNVRKVGAGLTTNHNFGKESRIFGFGDIYFNMILDLFLESFILKLGYD